MSRTCPRRITATLLVLAVFAPAATAAQSPGEGPGGVPESPAFRYLGTTPGSVTRPTSIRDLGASLITFVNPAGHLVQGVALDLTPWVLLPSLTISPETYGERGLAYVLANTQLSFGTARVGSDTASTDAAVGLRITFYDGADPMADAGFRASLGESLQGCLPDDPTASTEGVEACADDVTSKAYAAYTKEHWNASQLALGAAAGVRLGPASDGAATPATAFSGFRAWLTGAKSLGARGQFLLQAEYMDQAALANLEAEDKLSYGGRLLLGSDHANLFGELVGARTWYEQSDADNSFHWSAGLEVRVAKDVWVSTGYGRRYSELDAPTHSFVLANVRLGITSASRLNGVTTPGL